MVAAISLALAAVVAFAWIKVRGKRKATA